AAGRRVARPDPGCLGLVYPYDRAGTRRADDRVPRSNVARYRAERAARAVQIPLVGTAVYPQRHAGARAAVIRLQRLAIIRAALPAAYRTKRTVAGRRVYR